MLAINCFNNCSQLETVILPSSVETIDNYAFASCKSLKNFTLPVSLKSINQRAFDSAEQLETIIIPKDSELTTIYEFAFSNTNLKTFDTKESADSFSFENGILYDFNKTKLMYFISSTNTKSLVLPGSIKEILPYAFYGAEYLVEVIIPDGSFEKIGIKAFMDCPKLRRVVLPDSLITLDADSFSNTKIVCGGLILNEKFTDEDCKNAGFSDKAISPGCRNNFDALLVKNTCQYDSSHLNLHLFAIILTISSNK